MTSGQMTGFGTKRGQAEFPFRVDFGRGLVSEQGMLCRSDRAIGDNFATKASYSLCNPDCVAAGTEEGGVSVDFRG
jgi:hypothetical protein